MPVRVRCPGCDSLYRLSDPLAGKNVRCKNCGQIFRVPGLPPLEPIEVPEPEPAVAAVTAAAQDSEPAHGEMPQGEDFEVTEAAADEDVALGDSPGVEPQDADAIEVESPDAEVLDANEVAEEAVEVEEAPAEKPGKGKKAKAPRKPLPMKMLAIAAVVGLVVIGGGLGAWFFLFSSPTKTAKTAPKGLGAGAPNKNVPKGKGPKGPGGAPEAAMELVLPAEDEPVSYVKHVKPFLKFYCGNCHGSAKPKAGINLSDYQAIKNAKQDELIVIPDDPDNSLLVKVVEHKADHQMPPPKEKRQPKEEEKSMLRKWVKEGAKDDSTEAGALPASDLLKFLDAAFEQRAWQVQPLNSFALRQRQFKS